MKLKIVLGSLAAFLLMISGLMLYVLSQMNIQYLISCSSGARTRIPSKLCEYYMVNYRITDANIKELNDGAGLDFILNGQEPIKYKIAEIFISKGLDVDGVNHYSGKDVTPLHAAVLFNDVERVNFLLKQGADIHIKSEGYGMTTIELAKKLHEETGRENRSEIITLLSDAAKRPISVVE